MTTRAEQLQLKLGITNEDESPSGNPEYDKALEKLDLAMDKLDVALDTGNGLAALGKEIAALTATLEKLHKA